MEPVLARLLLPEEVLDDGRVAVSLATRVMGRSRDLLRTFVGTVVEVADPTEVGVSL